MRKLKILTVFLVIISITFLTPKYIHRATADPIPMDLYYAGGLLPSENVSLSLTHANVFIDVDTKNLVSFDDFDDLYVISLIGNYTIFNVDNEINFTLGAPFCFSWPPFGYSINVTMNNSSVPYILIDDYTTNSTIWNQYLNNSLINTHRYWVLCNISISEESSLKIQYKIKSYFSKYTIDKGELDIIYDVGTSRLWNGTITETVEVHIHGKLPNSVYNKEICTITDISDGKSYKWEWSDEIINLNFVGVKYSFESSFNQPDYTLVILLSLVALGPIIFIVIIQLKKIYKKER